MARRDASEVRGGRTRALLRRSGRLLRVSPATPYLLGHLLALSVPVALLTALHPPLSHPDPLEFRRVGLAMLADGRLLVTWDPPVRYFPLYLLYALARPSTALAGRLVVLQTALFSYLLVPLALYGLFATVRSPAAGLLAVTVAAFATAAGLPPTALARHHPQVAVALPFALCALALGHATVATVERGDRRRTVAWAAGTALVCGLALNVEPWIAMLPAVGVACAWAAHGAWRALATATTVGAVGAAPLALVPEWEVHLVLFVIEVIEPSGPLVTAGSLADAALAPGTYGVLALLGAIWWLHRQGGAVPGGAVVGFAVLAGAWTWGLFRLTTLSGVGTRGLVWLLTLAVPAVAVQAADAADGRVGDALARLSGPDRARPGEWLALYAAEASVLAVSALLYVATFEPPA